jgi:membrane-associated phospholipid phosphatase
MMPETVPRRTRVLLLVALGYALFAATYVPINHWSIGRSAHSLFLPGESRLPFLPELEYLYGLTYLLPWLLVVTLGGARSCLRTGLAFLLVLAAAYASYALLPVYLERPQLEVDSLATWLLALEYRDPSYNHFPSLHVAISWLVYLAVRRDARRLAAILMPLVIGISASTLFVKQHYAADVVYGALLAVGAWALAGRLLDFRHREPSGKTTPVRHREAAAGRRGDLPATTEPPGGSP